MTTNLKMEDILPGEIIEMTNGAIFVSFYHIRGVSTKRVDVLLEQIKDGLGSIDEKKRDSWFSGEPYPWRIIPLGNEGGETLFMRKDGIVVGSPYSEKDFRLMKIYKGPEPESDNETTEPDQPLLGIEEGTWIYLSDGSAVEFTGEIRTKNSVGGDLNPETGGMLYRIRINQNLAGNIVSRALSEADLWGYTINDLHVGKYGEVFNYTGFDAYPIEDLHVKEVLN